MMKEELKKLLDNCIAPVPSLRFSAIVVMKDGNKFSGVSIKNAIFRGTISAEMSAISQAVTKGYKRGDFDKIYIMVGSNSLNDLKYLNRAVISEFLESDREVICMDIEGNEKVFKVKDLGLEIFSD